MIYIVQEGDELVGYAYTRPDADTMGGEVFEFQKSDIPHLEYFYENFMEYQIIDGVLVFDKEKNQANFDRHHTAEEINEDDTKETEEVSQIVVDGVQTEVSKSNLDFLHLQVDSAILSDTDVSMISDDILITVSVETAEKILEELTIEVAKKVLQRELLIIELKKA